MLRITTAIAIALAALCLQPRPTNASTLTWGAGYSWSLGDISNNYVVDGVNLDITIEDLNNPYSLDPGSGPLSSPGSPQTSTYLNPTGNGGEANLFLKAPDNTNGVQVTIVFDQPVIGVNFRTYDVDATGSSGLGAYVDRVGAVASDGASSFGPTSVTGNGSEAWALQGDGQTILANENADQTGGNSANGTALWAFDVPLTSITITYENANPAAGVQWIGLSHINFTLAPEPSTGVLLGLGLVGLALRRRHTSRRP